MRCVSCGMESDPTHYKRFHALFLCYACYPLAISAQAEIDRGFEQAKILSRQWLEKHILDGKLWKGARGEQQGPAAGGAIDTEYPPGLRDVYAASSVPVVRSDSRGPDASDRGIHPGDETNADTR